MKSKILTGVFLLVGLLAFNASAQVQDPGDQGVADTIRFVISQPAVSANPQIITAQLYFYNNPQNVTNVSAGFGWDNTKVIADSVVWSPEAMGAFNLSRLVWYRNNRDSTNARRLFQCVGMRIFGDGILPSTSSKLIATYYFHTPNWTATDAFCINVATFNKLAFTDLISTEYTPIWPGTTCVGNVITGVLQTSPGTLNFTGIAGGTAPANQSFNVTEAAGDLIAYTAATSTSWLNLVNPAGTTPGTVGVGINMTGLAAGDHQGTINVTSAEATNTATVTVNLHLDQPNRPPELAAIGNRSVDENALLQFTITATDPDLTTPHFTTSALPTGASFVDNNNGTGTFSWTPGYDAAGAYPVTFTATDGSLTDSEAITITVNNVNRPPVLAAIGPQQVSEGVLLTFGATATDPDMTALTFAAVDLPTGSSFADNGNNTATFNWTPGNTAAGMYNVWVIVSDGALADSELVAIEVVDADGFVVNPSTLNFTAQFNGVNPDPQNFNVSIGDGSNIPFMVQTTATWIQLAPSMAATPADIAVTVNIAGLAAGSYRDSIQVMEQEIPVTMASPEAYEPVWVYVNLTVGNALTVSPTEVSMTQSEGALNPATDSFNVTEAGGGAISFAATEDASWFSLDPVDGTTPQEVMIMVSSTDLAPGDYFDSVIVASDAAVNSPQKVYVHLTVTPCPDFVTPQVVFNTTIFAGETATVDQMVGLASTTEDGIDWLALPSTFFTFDPVAGNTSVQNQVHVTYARMIDEQGVYADTARIQNNRDIEGLNCPAEMLIIVNVTVNRPPSADTVIVVNTPAVPGMRVEVPVLFTNSCQLTGLGLSLNWTGGMVLDSVSFAGSVLSYIEDKNVAINNDLFDVTITASVGDQMLVPIGSQQLMGTLFFALPCEIEEGTYDLNLGAYPPLTPGDVYFYRDCGEGVETEYPEYIPGAIIVGTASNYVCGYVVDPADNEIEGATVELWADYPLTEPLMSTHSSSIGGFAFDDIMVIPFDLYAYKEGYYPGKVEDINFGDKGIKIVLTPLPELTPTSQWVDYFCPENPEGANWFLGAPVPVGAVVEAYTQDNLLVGQTMVIERGKYGFMPVYRASNEFGDPGAVTGDRLHFTINGMDAVASGNVIYPPDYAQVEVCLEVRGTVEKVCTLVEGWNLLSWNVNTDSDDILDVLAPIMNNVDVVLGFERGGLTFDPDLQMFSTLHDVDHLSGYWVKIEGVSQIDLTITGLPVMVSTPIPVTPGWNLVSYLPDESWSVEDALASIEGITLFAYGFPGGTIQVWQPGSQFNQLESMDPCNGYWIKTSASGLLVYDQIVEGVLVSRPTVQEAELAVDGVIATTSWINLYSSDLKFDGRQVPAGARIAAYSVAGDHKLGSFTVESAGRFGFMPVYADAAGENVVGLKAGDQFYLTVDDVKTAEVFTWTANGDRVEVTQLAAAGSNTTVVPDSYSLSQNYPNPFNPITTITFSMPANGRAKLEIFNVLGASVAVVYDGQAVAGEHEVVWDGRDSDGNQTASGVYFYRLTADNYTETRKMMLLK